MHPKPEEMTHKLWRCKFAKHCTRSCFAGHRPAHEKNHECELQFCALGAKGACELVGFRTAAEPETWGQKNERLSKIADEARENLNRLCVDAQKKIREAGGKKE